MGIERFAMADRFVEAAARARLVEPQGPPGHSRVSRTRSGRGGRKQIRERYSVHDLRRAFAVRLYEATRDVYQAVEKALGHATVAVTKTPLCDPRGWIERRVKDGKASENRTPGPAIRNTEQGVGRDGKRGKYWTDNLQGDCTLMQKVRHRLHG